MEADKFYNLIQREQQEKFYGLNTLAGRWVVEQWGNEGAKAKCSFGPISCWVQLAAAENRVWGQGDFGAVGKWEFGVFSSKHVINRCVPVISAIAP